MSSPQLSQYKGLVTNLLKEQRSSKTHVTQIQERAKYVLSVSDLPQHLSSLLDISPCFSNPVSKAHLWLEVCRLYAQAKTALMTSHIL